MSSLRPASHVPAFLLALVATLATMGGVDHLAARPGDQSLLTQLASANADATRTSLTAPTFHTERIVVIGRRARA